jgi:hypothetical protein
MATKTIKNVMMFGIIVAAVLIGMTFIMSSSASAAVAAQSAGIVRPGFNEPVFAPRVAPRPFVQPFFPRVNPFFPRINPFFPRINPFFFDVDADVNPFFFNEGLGFEED